MKLNLIRNFLLISIILFFSCQTTKEIIKKDTYSDRFADLPDNIWLTEGSKSRVDSLFSLASLAHQKLENKDTLGAELTYDFAFGLLMRFQEQDIETLRKWDIYDSVMVQINRDYEKIINSQFENLAEAEEIREDIVDLEERTFPDSILFGNGELIDTSSVFPITINKKVRLAIKYFQTKGRKVFQIWLERMSKYHNLVKNVFKEKGLPEELSYLPLIESGFNPKARSYARAVGMWQFISSTGGYYGLRHNWWFDERKDFVKATNAAAEHLEDLYERFDHWYLALAGYNCNPKRVERNMRRYNTRDYWKLSRLPRQTRNYVPTFLAAYVIASDPEKFGFYLSESTDMDLDTIIVSESIDLNVIAKCVDTSYSYIKEINPAVLRWVTPPGIKDFTVYIPAGKKELFRKNYTLVPDSEKRSWVRHKIKSGETLSTIAQKYHTTVSVLKSTNKLRSNIIRTGAHLLIPVPQNKAGYYAAIGYNKSKKNNNYVRKSPTRKENKQEYDLVTHVVKKGETLGGIAEKYNTRASKIRSWNGLYYGQYIFPDQKLKIYVPKNKTLALNKKETALQIPANAKLYIVRPGDTLWDISREYGVTISSIQQVNKKQNTRIKPGEKLIIPVKN